MFRKKQQTAPREAAPMDVNGKALADIAAETWRLDRVIEKAVVRMEPMDAERFLGQYRWFQKRVNAALLEADYRLVDLTGQDYSVGMAATPLNMEEFDDGPLVVEQMVEPIIMHGGEVVRTGSVLLGRKEA